MAETQNQAGEIQKSVTGFVPKSSYGSCRLTLENFAATVKRLSSYRAEAVILILAVVLLLIVLLY